MTKLIPNNEPRNINFAQNGDDDKGGESPTFALATLGAAITRVNNLVPVPTIDNPASIIGNGAGTFTDSGELIDFVQILAAGSRFVNADPDWTIKLNDFCSIESTLVWNIGAGASILFEDCSITAAYQRVVRASGGGAAFKVRGNTDSILMQASQVRTLGGIGVDINSTIGEPAILDIDDMVLTVDNDVAFDITAIGGKVTGKIGNISSSSTTGTEAIFRSGQVILQGDQINVDTLTVKDGAEVWLNDYIIESDIVVEAGGILHCRIYQGAGYSITNNGSINGNINGVDYGSFVTPDEKFVTMSDRTNLANPFRVLGYFDIDTTNDTIDSASAFYTQSNPNSRTANFRIVDAGDSTVYFSGSNTDTGVTPKSFQLASVNPLPANQVVFMAVEYSRTGGAGLSDPSIKVEVSST